MFDLPYDPALQDVISNLYLKKGTVISSVCHGPAAFVNVKNGDDYIIKDVELTSFCNIEEELFGKKWVKEFPFSLETKLESRGAIFRQTDFMLSKVKNLIVLEISAYAVVSSPGCILSRYRSRVSCDSGFRAISAGLMVFIEIFDIKSTAAYFASCSKQALDEE